MKLTRAQMDAMLTELIATGNAFDPVAIFVGLFITLTDNGPATVLADGTYPDGTDMPRQAGTAWGSIHHLVDGRSAVDLDLLTFVLPGSTNAFTAGGYYIASALTAGSLLAYEAFADPIPMPDQFSPVDILLRLTIDAAGNWSASVVIDG